MKIVLKERQKIYISSDLHFSHTNLCRGVSNWTDKSGCRNFNSLEEMNEIILKGINDYVKEDDILILAGDIILDGGKGTLPIFMKQIICKNIILVTGNHDNGIKKNHHDYQSLFQTIHNDLMLEVHWVDELGIIIETATFYISHHPSAVWPNLERGVIHTHGHIHSTPAHKFGKGKMIDIGMDGNNMKVYDMLEIVNVMKNITIESYVKHKIS